MNHRVSRLSRFVLTHLLPGWRQRRSDRSLAALARELAGQGRIVLATACDPSGRPALVFAEAHAAAEVAGCRMPGVASGEEERACLDWLRAEGWVEAVEAAPRRIAVPADGRALCVRSDDGLPLCCH